MIRLRRLELVGFRGALNPLPLDFTPQCRSMAIFGENATGKSSVTDGIEWFYTDRVDHLWREHCKESALRHVLLPDDKHAWVRASFSDKTLEATKTLDSNLRPAWSHTTGEFHAYLHEINDAHDRFALRNAELLEFVVSTKSQKREQLAKIIGYEALDGFRDVIQRTQTQLERDNVYVAAKQNHPQLQAEITKLAGSMVANHAELYATAQRMAASRGVALTIVDNSTYSTAITEIRNRIGQTERASRKLVLSQLKRSYELLDKTVHDAESMTKSFLEVYSDLIQSKKELGLIKLENLLSLGKGMIEQGLSEANKCPLCLQRKDHEELKEELSLRLEKLTESKKKQQAATTQKGYATGSLKDASRKAEDAIGKAKELATLEDLVKKTATYKKAVDALIAHIEGSFANYEPVTSTLEKDTSNLTTDFPKTLTYLADEIKKLELSREEQTLIDLVQELENLRATFSKYQQASLTKAQFEAQIHTLATMKRQFAEIHSTTLQRVLDVMSGDISRYYLAMHPDENVDNLRLVILDGGVEFEYSFHGQHAYPPLKYLSESHLNSLGIAAFLASTKMFNKLNGFVVLDDVITSFDVNHRLRLLRLLREEFKDWQILLLTHEPVWFEMIKKELLPDGWLAEEVELLPGIGITIKPSPSDLRELLARKKATGILTPNDVRILLENLLKRTSCELEVKVAFRYNDANERRMPGELVSELRSKLKKKNQSVKDHPVLDKIATSSLIATKGSHDSGPVLSTGDLAIAYQDVLELDELFSCPNCPGYVGIERYVPHENKIYCGCGKKSLDWKD